VARGRQRAKQRQAERRAARLGEQANGRGREGAEPEADPTAAAQPAGRTGARPAGDGDAARGPDLTEDREVAEEAHLAASAPPEDTGRTDSLLAAPGTDDEDLADEEDYDPEDSEQPLIADEAEADTEQRSRRGRIAAFLAGVVAELKRVQWPDRAQLISLTGVVLGFVLLAGGYLGLLDAIFSRLVQAIL
jgi:preprotein translocase SecE subunit